jgi:hypothetical protein
MTRPLAIVNVLVFMLSAGATRVSGTAYAAMLFDPSVGMLDIGTVLRNAGCAIGLF